ncbi:MAG TPA: hypothetical protein VK447_08615 [Myxococcaceae bacterium]|nr:hypothetical protein [Myxococcaceae bacterium]
MLGVAIVDRNDVVLPPRSVAGAQPPRSAKSTVPFWVHVPEPLLGPLPSRIRTRIWLTLAQVARNGKPVARGLEGLGDGYHVVYQVDETQRAVTLLEVEYRAESEISA